MNTHVPHPPSRATQAAEGLLRRAWTVAEIETIVKAGFSPEDERFELIGGEIVPMRPKGCRHEHYKASLLEYWMKRKTSSCRIIPETTFRLDEYTFVEPDFVFYDARVQVPQLAPSNTLLAVEIAHTTLSYDKGRKARIYANHGVKALWVIDVNSLETHVFGAAGPNGFVDVRLVEPNSILAPYFAPELALNLASLEMV